MMKESSSFEHLQQQLQSLFDFSASSSTPTCRTTSSSTATTSSTTSTTSTIPPPQFRNTNTNNSSSNSSSLLLPRSSSSPLRVSLLQSIQEEEKDQQYGHLSSLLVASNALHGAIDKAIIQRHNRQGQLGQGLQGGSRGGGARIRMVDNDNAHDQHGEFLDLLDSEIERVTQTISSQWNDQELSAKAVLSSIDEMIALCCADARKVQAATQYLRAKISELCQTSLQLQRFVNQNATMLREVALRADAELVGMSCTSHVNCRLTVSPWNKSPNLALVVVLSDIYNDIRKLEQASNSSNSNSTTNNNNHAWVVPSTFQRRTTKYWVRGEDRLTELLLAAVAEAPLLVYGKSGRLTSSNSKFDPTRVAKGGGGHDNDDDNNTLSSWDSLATPISSVYFDSPSTMCMYKERLQRLEGAQLFRIRWYGTTKPNGHEPVFLELKTHHEEWIMDQSVKERVTIQERDVGRFLSSSTNCWTRGVAKELVLAASPTLSGEKLDAQVELMQKMHHLVVSKGLRPCVRSMYNRVAFQSTNSNALRLTLDRNVTLIDETTQQTADAPPPGTWCLPDDAVTTDSMIAHVPYSVFEVKLCNCEMPSVFQHLVDNGTLMEAPKFSKFITGAAAFHNNAASSSSSSSSRVVVPDILLPYWAEEPKFRDLTFKGSNTVVASNNCNREDSIKNSKSSETTTHGKKWINFTNITSILGGGGGSMTSSPDSNKEERRTNDTTLSLYSSPSCSSARNDTKGSSPGGSGSFLFRRRSTTTEHQQNASESSSSRGGKGGGGKSGGKSGGALLFGFVHRPRTKKSSEHSIKFAPKRLARVEPKSYFANERTFIQWISAALMLITVSVILLNFQSVNGVSSTPGLILIACAFVIIIYSLFSYYRRLKLLQNAAPYGYVDHFGPIVLGLAVLLGVSTLLYYYITHTMQVNRSSFVAVGKTLMADPGGNCVQHPIIGTSRLQYEPSGVIVDKDRDLLLVPSLDSITALSTVTPDLPMETLVVIPGSDLEALTYVGDRVFALGEGKDSLKLFELGWNRSSLALFVKQEWELETTGNSLSAEGLVHIPDPNSANGGSLYVAGDNFDPAAPQDRGVVFIYDLPLPMPVLSVETTAFTTITKIKRTGMLNSNLLNLDLNDPITGIQLDSKIGDLHYFDGILYVLHDNAEVIRAWDATSGDLLATMRLPHVSKKFSNRQWEGMALEYITTTGSDRRTTDSNSFLRRASATAESPSPPSTLMLHLALDTPPQLWSFAVTTLPTSRGSIVFPSCAAAY